MEKVILPYDIFVGNLSVAKVIASYWKEVINLLGDSLQKLNVKMNL